MNWSFFNKEKPDVWIEPSKSKIVQVKATEIISSDKYVLCLRWLDIVFQGQYLPSLSVNYVAINKDLEKLTPQLYKIKKKIGYDQGSNDIGVVIATKWRHYLFYFQQYFSALGTVLPKSFTGAFTYDSCLDVREV